MKGRQFLGPEDAFVSESLQKQNDYFHTLATTQPDSTFFVTGSGML